RARNPAHGVGEQPPHAGVDELHEVVECALPDLVAGQPVGHFGAGSASDSQAVASDLGPDVRLDPMEPGAADLQIAAEAVVGPYTAAQSVARLQHQDAPAGTAQFAGGDQSGDPAADHDNIGLLGHGDSRRGDGLKVVDQFIY